ncbi:MAG: tetratricopeptide repeat protein, partial [Acidimicrobiia bacterium]
MDYVSRLAGSALYWLAALGMLALVLYGLVDGLGGFSFRSGQSVALVVFLFGVGLLTLWRRRNFYLRAAFGTDRHLFRGLLYERFRKRERALRAFSLHLKRFPANVQALKKRAEMLQELGKVEDALADLDTALAPYPDPQLLDRRGLLLMSLGANREALADFEQAASLRGRAPGFLCAGALIQLRLLDRALAAVETTHPEEEHRFFVVHRRWYRGEALRLLGREAEARAYFQEALDGLEAEPPVHDRDGRFHCVPDLLGHLRRNDEARQLIQFGIEKRKVMVSGD